MLVTRLSQFTRKENTMDLNVTNEQMERFENRRANGEYVQTIFPHLSQGEREFILTGVTPAEWDAMFGPSIFNYPE